ncbi:unnamed protein product [Schistosoma margrebowiei]|uniref:Frizzled/Smoothened transmembrane domain-containing protein n=1 Tax=Schistosoma margrebowiei TaxID=48269 RepID=A0AA85AG13_9TREM|nr:unnamed protein product [Schistosoma margrebowiei]
MLIIYIIIPLILIRSCQSGSSSKQSNCTEEQRSSFMRFVSAVGTFISLLCFLDGIWNTIAGFLHQATQISG